MKTVVTLLLAAIVFGYRSTESVLRCFLHCHGEPAAEITRQGWPFAYWSREVEPGDPPFAHDNIDVLAFAVDSAVFGLLLCGVAITVSALRAQRPTLADHLRKAHAGR